MLFVRNLTDIGHWLEINKRVKNIKSESEGSKIS